MQNHLEITSISQFGTRNMRKLTNSFTKFCGNFMEMLRTLLKYIFTKHIVFAFRQCCFLLKFVTRNAFFLNFSRSSRARAGPIQAHMVGLLVPFRTFRVQNGFFDEISRWFCMVLRGEAKKHSLFHQTMPCGGQNWRLLIEMRLKQKWCSWIVLLIKGPSRAHTGPYGPMWALMGPYGPENSERIRKRIRSNKCLWGACHPTLRNSLQTP